MRQRLPSLLIVDIDNTLFDWVGVWYRAFSAMLDELGTIERDALLTAFRAIHVKHGTTEYPFALTELSSIEAERDRKTLPPERLHAGAARYRREAESALTAYPAVLDTLAWFRGRGTRLVAFTETRADVSAPRLRALGLDGLIEIVYAPGPFELNARRDERGARSSDLTLWPYGEPAPEETLCRPIDRHAKPNASALRQILADLDVRPDEALYIGDHLDKDIRMAQQAGVPCAWARYGTIRRAHELALLDAVCHWSIPECPEPPTEPRLERPTFVLDSMADLRELFDDERATVAGRLHRNASW
jgi:phosphoglycolate phosphatase-like HAD superfamily hydrolase